MKNIHEFILDNVIKRQQSMFVNDIDANKNDIRSQVYGNTVLVIGGAGTIGSSFIKAILPFEPESLVVVDINENELTELTRDLRSTAGLYMPDEYITYPMNYADLVFAKMFRKRKGFDIVANFSAHKHVRSEKDLFSVEALLQNNVLNAKKLLDLLEEFPPKKFFCVSTDKAANPVNIMGASKKVMEDMIMTYSSKYCVTTARFANVAFSNGSLPLGFLNRIEKRQPLSAPSDVTRYFVSPEESGQICLMACVLGNTGEIFFPKLQKEQVMTFSSMAKKLLEAKGYEVDECDSDTEAIEKAKLLTASSKRYPVYFSPSDTSGEKQYEEFYTEGEDTDQNRFEALGVVVNLVPRNKEEIEDLFDELNKAFSNSEITKSDIVRILGSFLKNFEHLETGKTLDSKI